MINEALEHYYFRDPTVELIRHNENMTYKITDSDNTYVLRIHEPSEGFDLGILRSTKDEIDLIKDEINLLNYLAVSGNMQTQRVKPNARGEPVTILSDVIPVTVLEWVEGVTLEKIDITPEIAIRLGAMIGKLHNELAQGTFENRYCYDSTLLSRMIGEVSRASAQGDFGGGHAKTIVETLSRIKSYLSDSCDRFIPVHADMGKSNLVYHNEIIVPIDFSLSGYCVPEMDLASIFTHINDEVLNQKVLSGYSSISQIEPDNLGIEMCFCLQILLFVVFQHNRFADEKWFQERLTYWCEKYFIPLKAKSME